MEDESILNIYAKGEQLLDVTQAMLAAATADDWDEFESLEQRRRIMLETIFDNQTMDESTKLSLVGPIEEIQLIDKAISDLITQQRDQAAEELRHLKHAHEGNKAYRKAADELF
ncbi:MAG: flagellar protein FliT [Methylobacter sp.]|uniref:flagellar protein FliT n=1 Tax=Methylobacter sp. TaxID=2051955 RepID=UPI002730A58F|nr:flagellar protein FliT [Methylobacter sp.]MDP1665055.1 flagellar protein FliT [Methylobacter sp.]